MTAADLSVPRETVYQFAWYWSLVPISMALCIALLTLRAFLRNWPTKSKLGLPLVLLIVIGAIPGMIQDRVVVTSENIYKETSYWFVPRRQGFEFNNVDYISKSEGKKSDIWIVHHIDGAISQISIGKLWRDHSDEIQKRLEACRVEFR